MSSIDPAASAYYVTARPAADSSITQPTAPRAPQRETELTRQLDDRLTSEISRIRRQIAPDAALSADSPDGRGRLLDIRA